MVEKKGGEKRMSNLGNKEAMAKNLLYYMERKDKQQALFYLIKATTILELLEAIKE